MALHIKFFTLAGKVKFHRTFHISELVFEPLGGDGNLIFWAI